MRSGFPFFRLLILLAACPAAHAASWRDANYRETLQNDALKATIQAGRLIELRDKRTGKICLLQDPDHLPASLSMFDRHEMDLDRSTLARKSGENESSTEVDSPDGAHVEIRWSMEPGDGDLVLQVSAECPQPEGKIRFHFRGFDITDHPFVIVDGQGVGRVHPAPFTGSFVGGVLVALFQGEESGWVMEGRGPEHWHGNFTATGHGQTMDISAQRNHPVPTRALELMELRFRTYLGHWADAVDPHIEWMEKGAGYAPLGTGYHPEWVGNISAQSYVRVGDFDRLDVLARRVDPARTVIGRQVAYRHYPIDHFWPDYRPTDTAKKWFRRARKLGFHVGAHFNSKGIDYRFPELIEKYHQGLNQTGVDEHGDPVYEGADELFAYCSVALEPFRTYIISQIEEAVDAGVDLIYWDQSGGGGGAAVVNGVDTAMGIILLIKETLETYPGVAVETEQFNPMCTRYASFSLSQMGTGHPLGGYIFHRFINILPESKMIAPTQELQLDANQSFGHFIPSALDESWVQIADAFQRYELVPDVRLPRKRFTHYVPEHAGGVYPVIEKTPPEGEKLFGYRGRDGVTAFFEKFPDRRGLVVYEPGREPRWVGTRIGGIRTWDGPGIVREWEDSVLASYDPMAFNGDSVIGLDPGKTYALEPAGVLPSNRFHITAIPDDFAWWKETEWRIRHQDIGHNESFYRLCFTGNGDFQMAVPDDDYDLYLNGEPIPVDRHSKAAQASVVADQENPATLLAVRKIDVELAGRCVDLPWESPLFQRSWYFGRLAVMGYPADGPVLQEEESDGFYIHVGGTGQIVGKFPEAGRIRLQGAYGMRQGSSKTRGHGIVRINGREVLNIDPGNPPYRIYPYDVDLTEFAGQYALIEFASEGEARDSVADWFAPVIVTEP
jgi:hypothetical protein